MTKFAGHPLALKPICSTMLLERFSFYGSRAALFLFMKDAAATGGLGLTQTEASVVYGLYTTLVYLFSLPGGWIGDRFLRQRVVLFGSLTILAGYIAFAIPKNSFFYIGLFVVSIGSGLFKPNLTTMLGEIYRGDDPKGEAGFSIYYMCVNIGASVGGVVCGFLAEKYNWRLGFGMAAAAMVAGVIRYRLGLQGSLRNVGLSEPNKRTSLQQQLDRRNLGIGIAIMLAVIVLSLRFIITNAVSLVTIYNAFGWLLLASTTALFLRLIVFSTGTSEERRKMLSILCFFGASVVFWSVFEQDGSSLNEFAQCCVARKLLQFSVPATWFQSANPVFVILLTPVFVWLWAFLDRERRAPTIALKFAAGLTLAGLGISVLALPTAQSRIINPIWLVGTYLSFTAGELFLSPVGQKAMAKLAPDGVKGLVMGIWFLSGGAGRYVAGQFASQFGKLPNGRLFAALGGVALVAAAILAAFGKLINRLSGEDRREVPAI